MYYSAEKLKFVFCTGLINRYLSYCLIASSRYTTSKYHARWLAVLAFISSILIKAEIKDALPFHTILDTMLDIIGNDFRMALPDIQKRRFFDNTESFPSSSNARKTASALNALEPCSRLLLVLRYIDSCTPEQLAVIFDVPVLEIHCWLIIADYLLAQNLASVFNNSSISTEDVPMYLSGIKCNLETTDAGSIINTVLDYLITAGNCTPAPESFWSYHNVN